MMDNSGAVQIEMEEQQQGGEEEEEWQNVEHHDDDGDDDDGDDGRDNNNAIDEREESTVLCVPFSDRQCLVDVCLWCVWSLLCVPLVIGLPMLFPGTLLVLMRAIQFHRRRTAQIDTRERTVSYKHEEPLLCCTVKRLAARRTWRMDSLVHVYRERQGWLQERFGLCTVVMVFRAREDERKEEEEDNDEVSPARALLLVEEERGRQQDTEELHLVGIKVDDARNLVRRIRALMMTMMVTDSAASR